ncbi:hypothetical protein [Methylobacterium isbiliense]|uniref:Secreted protein n=1 Tax=Methylobacterium isbiliense TaxID=315478 RepID=A0ABQ4SI63_9HYPH|nr:hypothetical protein [Methylobacterium isbiliense]MDN3625847.1 hypothetical protein [Methylobacterium isbiliense]GJE02837.1 hypothetical protein GMJLKIPL_4786 [Methylobacterium isbiliense]
MMLRLTPLTVGAMLAVGPTQADHRPLKRALQQAGCIARNTSLVLRDGARSIYGQTCLCQSPDRVLVVCTGRICLPDDPDHHSADDETS